ncbi:hypothetical protein EBR66_03150 [bacterium]|nr:hypothetical protein [bacterium]
MRGNMQPLLLVALVVGVGLYVWNDSYTGRERFGAAEYDINGNVIKPPTPVQPDNGNLTDWTNQVLSRDAEYALVNQKLVEAQNGNSMYAWLIPVFANGNILHNGPAFVSELAARIRQIEKDLRAQQIQAGDAQLAEAAAKAAAQAAAKAAASVPKYTSQPMYQVCPMVTAASAFFFLTMILLTMYMYSAKTYGNNTKIYFISAFLSWLLVAVLSVVSFFIQNRCGYIRFIGPIAYTAIPILMYIWNKIWSKKGWYIHSLIGFVLGIAPSAYIYAARV